MLNLPRSWWLCRSAVRRDICPMDSTIITNMHDKSDAPGSDAATRIPADEVVGWTSDPQLALNFLTIRADQLDEWLELKVGKFFMPLHRLTPAHEMTSEDDGTQEDIFMGSGEPISFSAG